MKPHILGCLLYCNCCSMRWSWEVAALDVACIAVLWRGQCPPLAHIAHVLFTLLSVLGAQRGAGAYCWCWKSLLSEWLTESRAQDLLFNDNLHSQPMADTNYQIPWFPFGDASPPLPSSHIYCCHAGVQPHCLHHRLLQQPWSCLHFQSFSYLFQLRPFDHISFLKTLILSCHSLLRTISYSCSFAHIITPTWGGYLFTNVNLLIFPDPA